MGGVNVQAINGGLVVFKRGPENLTQLKTLAGLMREHFRVALRCGSIVISDAKPVHITEQLKDLGGPRILPRVLEAVVGYFKANGAPAQVWDLQIPDLIGAMERNINLTRDLHQIAGLKDVVDTAAAVMQSTGLIVTLGGKDIMSMSYSSGGRVEALVGLRAICGPKGITFEKLALEILGLEGTGRWPLEELALIMSS